MNQKLLKFKSVSLGHNSYYFFIIIPESKFQLGGVANLWEGDQEMPLTTVAWLEVEMLELNSQKCIHPFLLQAHICWFFSPSNFNKISYLSRDQRLPIHGKGKSYPSRDEWYLRSCYSRSQIPVAARSKLWVWGCPLFGIAGSNSASVWSPVCCDCCLLSDRVLCDGPITRTEESYRMWCVWVWMRNFMETA